VSLSHERSFGGPNSVRYLGAVMSRCSCLRDCVGFFSCAQVTALLLVLIDPNDESAIRITNLPLIPAREESGEYRYLTFNPIVCGASVISSVINSLSTTDQARELCRPTVKTLLPDLKGCPRPLMHLRCRPIPGSCPPSLRRSARRPCDENIEAHKLRRVKIHWQHWLLPRYIASCVSRE
jgi:hypothetical protein